ncbi:MAG: hypothetical protein ACXVHD_29050 [Solirubrobacteraceae bacterium]
MTALSRAICTFRYVNEELASEAIARSARAPQPLEELHPLPLLEVAERVKGELLDSEDKRIVRFVGKEFNWKRDHLHMERDDDRALGAKGLALGIPVFHPFGYALTFHPDRKVLYSVNAGKGRPLGQVASVVTTRSHIESLFNWDRISEGLTTGQVKGLIDRLYRKGPFGFRGPASEEIPGHLTAEVNGVPTVQLIAPGYGCASNELIAEAIGEAGVKLLAITSANISSHLTGQESAAHYRVSGIKRDFGRREPQCMIFGHDESSAGKRYPLHAPMSVSIVGFHEDLGGGVVGIERWGSLDIPEIGSEVARQGLTYKIMPKAETRQLQASYRTRRPQRG